ncbi:MAG: hypothetical protein JWN70_587 [Planctomycetaceae bacterium]|nr:hypothetical protein [Planctomycetaceae bacterium]
MRISLNFRIFSALLTCLSIGVVHFIVGCAPAGPVVAHLSGVVTLDKAPVATGTIIFVPADGIGPAGGGPIKDGKYSAEVQPGPKTVQIRSPKKVGEKKAYANDPNSPVLEITEESIPAKYNAKSELKYTVEAKSDDADFALESK